MAGVNEGTPIAIVVLGTGAIDTARRIQARYPGSLVHGLASRVQADIAFTELGPHLRDLYARNTPIVALCAAGIVIRCLASALADKTFEPPVLAVAEDGSAVVPLLGGLGGVNVIAREIASALDVVPAITTSGELRFGTCLLNPPTGYVLADIEQGKRFVSDLLAGATTRVEGVAPWLDQVDLPRAVDARLAIRVTPHTSDVAGELTIHPRCAVAYVTALPSEESIVERVRHALRDHRIAPMSLAAVLAPLSIMGSVRLAEAAQALDVPLRFGTLPEGFETLEHENGVLIAIAPQPVDPSTLGQARGTLTVIGLGPGSADLMVPAARHALSLADDILGYETYVRMAGPFAPHQTLHCTDNREEMQRARHAFELASTGRNVVVVSSGDPGVFAMAAAVLEALDQARDNAQWNAVELSVVPGVSAALATAARAGAPLGHDFCMLSLSDNLKPWAVIEARLRHAAQADLVMAFYNPVSRARPWQLDRALDIVREHRTGATTVVLGRNIGRPGETLTATTLENLRSDQVDMRTMVIVGSSTTRCFPRSDGNGDWVYTPRWYE
ncbi:precorrin-3B C(17)-methyltransferase [Caballeronia mineralivorans]|uniref:precorrin-3B C(17)-methyltransferase n=1 Tax=Caballeronia mineralivorans TaxID=2010198 RepID=UPI002AFE233C|nr:precorrin-3B C(17)-methyltransferase [Caballeronia mineralivorans]MEA3104871.1 cobalt-precorrin hydrolase / cobalt-factor methyltransferase / precorrin-3B [Caballeronia mineralivorans]